MTAPETLQHDVEPMDEALTRLIGEEIYLFGHGTVQQENAADILTNGLDTRHEDLFSTADHLPTLADDPEAFVHNKETLEHWPHLGAQYVVVLGVERLQGEQVPHRRYLQSIVQPKPDAEHVNDAYDQPYAIDSRFIAGYFNAVDGTFIKNIAFDPHYDPALLATTVNPDIRRELDARNPLDMLGGTVVGHHETVALPLDPAGSDDSTVW